MPCGPFPQLNLSCQAIVNGEFRGRKAREGAGLGVEAQGNDKYKLRQVRPSNPPAPYNKWPQAAKILCSMLSETIFSLILQ